MLSKIKLSPSLVYFFSMLPIVAIYIYIFIFSMDTALDRSGYLRLMNVDYESRVEPLLLLIAYLLDFIVSSEFLKLITIQIFFFLLLLKALYNYIKPTDIVTLSKCSLAILLCIIIYSNPLGVQLRMGYATIIFVYLIVTLRKLSILLFIPFFMHFGTLLAILLLFYMSIFKVESKQKFILHTFFVLTIFTILFTNIESIFRVIGIPFYYFRYLESDREWGRLIPYSAVLYIILCLYILLNKKAKGKECWFALSGLWLVYVGFFLDFYLAFKMLYPISIYALFYSIKILPEIKNNYFYMITSYILFPFAFYYFALQVDLI